MFVGHLHRLTGSVVGHRSIVHGFKLGPCFSFYVWGSLDTFSLQKWPQYSNIYNLWPYIILILSIFSSYQRTDNADITSLALASYEHECFFGASSQEKLRKKTSDGDMGILDQSLFNDMCPGNCNGHGDCSSQQCSCYPGKK